jgi:hypothetical protein
MGEARSENTEAGASARMAGERDRKPARTAEIREGRPLPDGRRANSASGLMTPCERRRREVSTGTN